MKRLTARQLREAVSALDDLTAQLDIVGLESPVARRAGELAEEHGLRGYGAVHLAAGLAVDDDDVVFVTGDADLAQAARAEGMAVALTTRST